MSDSALLFIHAHTSLHPGSGSALGTVDLPVQRERHTRWPLIAGSAVKGVLRDACREQAKCDYQDRHEAGTDGQPGRLIASRRRQANELHDLLVVTFGPGKPEASSEHAGALGPTDARILAFPVRSARGVFAWVTCHAVLERLIRDLSLCQCSLPTLSLPAATPGKGSAFVPIDDCPLLLDENQIVLEEIDFDVSGDATAVAQWIAEKALVDEATRQRMRKRLAILPDDDFTHFVQHATEISARIGLDYETKTVKKGALFYQEFLPPETILYSLLIANDSRKDGSVYPARRVLDYVGQALPPVLQFGGDETTGKGFCAVSLIRANGGAA